MRLLTTETLNTASTLKQLSLWSDRQRAPDMTHDSPELLQCTPTVANDEAADSRYWTTYDHYMIEREARALRREYVYRMLTTGWRRLRERFNRIVAGQRRQSAPAGRSRKIVGSLPPR